MSINIRGPGAKVIRHPIGLLYGWPSLFNSMILIRTSLLFSTLIVFMSGQSKLTWNWESGRCKSGGANGTVLTSQYYSNNDYYSHAQPLVLMHCHIVGTRRAV